MSRPRIREARAAEYRQLAAAATSQAEASALDHVRQKHERAAAQWTALAELEEQPVHARLEAEWTPPTAQP